MGRFVAYMNFSGSTGRLPVIPLEVHEIYLCSHFWWPAFHAKYVPEIAIEAKALGVETNHYQDYMQYR